MATYVVGWLSTTEVVVVHGRKIVMNETHGVNHLQSNGSWHALFLGSTKHLTSSQAKNWTDSLASCHQGIKHRLANLLCLWLGRNNGSLEGSLNRSLLGEKVLIQVELGGRLDSQSA